MNPWFLLAVAIVAEVAGTLSLRASDGFSRPGPTAVVVVGYGIAFVLLAQVVRSIPVGVVYAVWAGVGIALTTVAARMLFGQELTPAAIAGIALILVGTVVLNLSGVSHR
ncbi:MAG: DMT family transporter [Egibacteraceae bacterium]